MKTNITDIKLQGESLIFGDRKSSNSINRIELHPDDQNLEISFSSLNHRYASKIRPPSFIKSRKASDSQFSYLFTPKTIFIRRFHLKSISALTQMIIKSRVFSTFHIYPRFVHSYQPISIAYLFYVLIVMGVSGYSLYLYLKRVDRKNNEMWADSKEMIKMRIYLDSKVNLPEPEFVQLDKLLLEKAVKAVEDNLTEPDFDVTALADAMNMSRSTLTRKLKAITGRTPLDFIRNIKMKHARHML